MAYSNFGAQFQAFVVRVANSIKELHSNITTLGTNVVKTVNNNKPINGNISPDQTGCLPLSGGDIIGNLTVNSKNVLRSINGVNGDSSGNVDVDTTLTKDKVTSALGYTPLQTAPVTSVNGKTGAVDLSGTYQPKGNYLTSAPVTSVMGKTGAVTGLVTSVNGTSPNASGAVTVSATIPNVSGATVSQSITKNSSFTLPCNAIVVFSYAKGTATFDSTTVNGKTVRPGFISTYSFTNSENSRESHMVLSNLSMPLPKGAVIKNANRSTAMTIHYTPI